MKFVLSNNKMAAKSEYVYKGYQIGIAGLLMNSFICITECISGIITNNTALLADAFHNLTDSIFAVVTLGSFLLANRPSNIKYPFGFGRVEYLGAFFLGISMLGMGIHFIIVSIERSLYPVPYYFNPLVFSLILLSAILKLFYSFFAYRCAKRFNSSIIRASYFDSLIDVVILSLLAASYIVSQIGSLQMEGVTGGIISIGILWSGYSVIKSAAASLIGKGPNPVLIKKIQTIIQKDARVKGYHHLLVHDYGIGKTLASVHLEVPAYFSLIQSHQISEHIEQAAERENIYLTIHIDPIETYFNP